MTRTRDEAEELGARQHEVEDLRKEEEEERFGEVRLDAHDRERHARHVAERVPREGACGVPGARDTSEDEYPAKRE